MKDIKAEQHGKFVRDVMQQDNAPARKAPAPKVEDQSGLNENEGKKIKLNRLKRTTNTTQENKAIATGSIKEEDMANMREAIQQLTQSCNPLGKSMDFVHDDIDNMMKEYGQWKQAYEQSNTKMEEQRRLTEDSLQSQYDKIAEIEEQIRDKQIKINHMRAQVLRNEGTIKSLLQNVVSAK